MLGVIIIISKKYVYKRVKNKIDAYLLEQLKYNLRLIDMDSCIC
jgi:hypothetical protein